MAAHNHAHTFTLSDLLPDSDLGSVGFTPINNLALDTRRLKAGDAFFALAGSQSDGRRYIDAAIAQGAVAVLVDADKDWQGISWRDQVPVIAVEQLADQMSEIAGRFYAHPSAQLHMIGITGTNGKTTCSLLLGQLIALLNGRAGVVGTLGFGLLDNTALAPLTQQVNALRSTGLTTPDPIALQHILAQLKEQGAKTVALEVSSHSLQQKRVAALQFDTAIFTNLTQDHLDYHGDLESYGKAKEQLLAMPGLKHVIVNADDAWAKSLLEKVAQQNASQPKNSQQLKTLSYSLSDSTADIYLEQICLTAQGASATIITPWGRGELATTLLGGFNLSNLLAVISAACVGGARLAEVLAVVPRLQAAPGRMQAIVLDQSDQDISAIVDYAHTPDALESTLKAIREHNTGRVWTVFGCGGDRDKSKRPLMGRIAEQLSDYVIVTNDNPRSEDPAAIAADILRGMHNTHGCLVIAERAQAIDLAVQQAKPGDVILVAGKGHEDYQIFAAQTLPFSDIKQVRLALQRRIARRDAQGASDEVSP